MSNGRWTPGACGLLAMLSACGGRVQLPFTSEPRPGTRLTTQCHIQAAPKPFEESVRGGSVLPENGRESQARRRGSLPKQAIREVITTNIGEVRTCFEQRISSDADRGQLVVKFVIAPSGGVQQVFLVSNETGLSDLPCCVRDAMLTWQFPEPDGGGFVVVTYPFVFEQEP